MRQQSRQYEVVVQFGSILWRFHPGCLVRVGDGGAVPEELTRMGELTGSNIKAGPLRNAVDSGVGSSPVGGSSASGAGSTDGYTSSASTVGPGGARRRDLTDYSDNDVSQHAGSGYPRRAPRSQATARDHRGQESPNRVATRLSPAVETDESSASRQPVQLQAPVELGPDMQDRLQTCEFRP